MNNYVALTKCYFCGGDNEILLDRKFRDISKMHGKVVSMHPCQDCEEKMKQGIMMIVIDSEKSTPNWHKDPMPNPHRTGLMVVVKEEAVKRIIVEPSLLESILKQRWSFVDEPVAEILGLVQYAN